MSQAVPSTDLPPPPERRSGAVYPFLAWRKRLGLSQIDAARLLDRTTRQIGSYEKMHELPPLVRLAMVGIEYLPSWRLAEIGIVPFWRRKEDLTEARDAAASGATRRRYRRR